MSREKQGKINNAEAELERTAREEAIRIERKKIQEGEGTREIKRRNNSLSQPGKNIKNDLAEILDYNLEDVNDNAKSIAANFLYNVEEAQPYNRVKYAGEQEVDLEKYISLRPDAGEILGRTNTESLNDTILTRRREIFNNLTDKEKAEKTEKQWNTYYWKKKRIDNGEIELIEEKGFSECDVPILYTSEDELKFLPKTKN